MNLSKIFFRSVFVFLALSLLSAPAFAVDVAPTGGTLVATVNFENAKITSQDGNTFNIAFSLTNREGVQDGVQYGLQLFSETSKGKFIVDEKIFDEKLTLAENSSVRKGISYTAPATLSGDYQLLLTSKNSAGFPFAFYPLGKVTLSRTTVGVQIIPESCSLSYVKTIPASPLSKMLVLPVGVQSLELSCSVVNNSSSAVSAVPMVQTSLRDSFGEKVETVGGDTTPVSFKPNEKKAVTIKIPLATKSQSYSATVSFDVAGVASNSVSFRYMITGPSATISNLSLDKDYYKRGETAALSLIWFSSQTKVNLEATLSNGYNMKCAKTIEQELTPGTMEVLFPVNSNCRDPHVSVTLKSDKGVVLDQKDFSVQTSAASAPRDSIPFVIVVVVALLAIFIIIKKKNKKNNMNTPNMSIPMSVFLPVIILAGVMSLIPFSSASADTSVYFSGPGGIIQSTVTVSPVTYNPSNLIHIDWEIYNLDSTNSYPVQLNAINDIGLGVSNPTTVLLTPTNIAAGGVISGYNYATFQAPASQGTYNVTFSTGVDDPIVPPSMDHLLQIFYSKDGYVDNILGLSWPWTINNNNLPLNEDTEGGVAQTTFTATPGTGELVIDGNSVSGSVRVTDSAWNQYCLNGNGQSTYTFPSVTLNDSYAAVVQVESTPCP